MFGLFSKRKPTIEERVSQTLNEVSVSVLLCGGVTYNVPPPTLATLVEVSALSSMLSQSKVDRGSLLDMLSSGEDAGVYAQMLSAFITGVRKGNDKDRASLSEYILEHSTVSEVIQSMQAILTHSDIGGLFMLTTSLREMRLTKPTREVVKNQTAPGQE